MMQISSLTRIQPFIRICQRGLHFAAVRQMGVKGLELRMPALSPTMAEGTIIKWLKKEGEQVNPGDALCEIQTDKAVMTFDIEEEGVLAKILLPDDSKDIKIGTLIGLLVEEGQDWKDVEVPTSGGVAAVTEQKKETESRKTVSEHANAAQKVTLGPAAKNLLLAYGLEQSAIVPSGPRSTLLKGDILKYVEAKKLKPVPTKVVSQPPKEVSAPKSKTSKPMKTSVSTGQTFVDVPNSERRQSLARSSMEAKTYIPHSYCNVDCRVDNVLELKKTLQTDGVQVTVEDFVVKATAVALQRVPEVNSRWTENGAQLLPNVDIAVGTQADNGPIAPIVRDAIGLGLSEISKRIKDLSEKASRGKLEAHEQSGASFTVSYLGDYGVTEFVTVVPQHQSAILAVGGPRIGIDEEGRTQTRFTATLSYDRRVFDEEVAARFLEQFASVLESPPLMLASLQSTDQLSTVRQF